MIRQYMTRFMAGRYGGDHLNLFLIALYLILYVVFVFTRLLVFELLGSSSAYSAPCPEIWSAAGRKTTAFSSSSGPSAGSGLPYAPGPRTGSTAISSAPTAASRCVCPGARGALRCTAAPAGRCLRKKVKQRTSSPLPLGSSFSVQRSRRSSP